MNWKHIRVPAELHAKLKTLAAHFDDCQCKGTMDVPAEFADPRGHHVGTPVYYVITTALDAYEDHKRRSRRKRPGGKPGRAKRRQDNGLNCPCGCGAGVLYANAYEVTYACGTTTNSDEGDRVARIGDACKAQSAIPNPKSEIGRGCGQ